MEIVKEKYFEDEDGYKKETVYRSGLKERILLEPSQKYIDEKIGPRIEAGERQRAKEKDGHERQKILERLIDKEKNNEG